MEDSIIKWINNNKISTKLVSLEIDSLSELISSFYTDKVISRNGKKFKIINKNQNKIYIEIYDKEILDIFYKKQVNSNWTYLKYLDYQVRWNITIHLHQEKSYQTNLKNKPSTIKLLPIKKAVINDLNKIEDKYANLTKLSRYFDLDSD
jgi:hypothetical protein